jgi:hypothetical protein
VGDVSVRLTRRVYRGIGTPTIYRRNTVASEETGILKKIMRALGSRKWTRAFRNNIGLAWFGTLLSNKDNIAVLKNPRRVEYGLQVGTSDIILVHSVEVTAAMVGRRVAVFGAIEVKTETGRVTEEQRNFIATVQRFGGIAGIARSETEAAGIVENWEREMGAGS